MNKYELQYLFLILSGIYIGVKLLCHVAILYLTFEESPVFLVVFPFYVPTNNVWEFLFPHIFATTILGLFFKQGY
jgi:hypothetical protein